MKKRPFLIAVCLVFIASFSSCHWHRGTSVSITDSRDEFRMTAHYEKRKTDKIREYLDRLEEHGRTSFDNARIDGKIALEDRTTFYIRLFPGELKIKFDKDENSDESYYKMKDVCEDIKQLIAGN